MSTTGLRKPPPKVLRLDDVILLRGAKTEPETLAECRERFEEVRSRTRRGPVRSQPDVAAHLFEREDGSCVIVGRKRGTGLLLTRTELGADAGYFGRRDALSEVLSETQEIAARQRGGGRR